ncbi:hypothetical protein [Acidipropionibacterium acidipropionici]|uniref:hypothetical protein n=1 Tax=Acidipropionibacterium acidipropionici TaxID=1748 RepID=UPI0004287C41|nr:hypothetical protein [Acidipropionibacterium acidipropionici]ALN14696.1 hypothetical protein ASQ49_04740 [Acidipropionibacterium acidipropionici]APZ09549.1 hypothetical protein BWX38_10185 [Acidipropionibacterium acidipropionici]
MRFAAETPPHINDAEAAPVIWLICGVAALVVAIAVPLAVALWRRHRYRIEQSVGTGDGIEPVRRRYLDGLARAQKLWQGGELTAPEALESCSGLVRQFIGVVTDTDVAALTLEELRSRAMLRPELEPVAGIVDHGYQARFAGRPVDDDLVASAFADARKVIEEWD